MVSASAGMEHICIWITVHYLSKHWRGQTQGGKCQVSLVLVGNIPHFLVMASQWSWGGQACIRRCAVPSSALGVVQEEAGFTHMGVNQKQFLWCRWSGRHKWEANVAYWYWKHLKHLLRALLWGSSLCEADWQGTALLSALSFPVS